MNLAAFSILLSCSFDKPGPDDALDLASPTTHRDAGGDGGGIMDLQVSDAATCTADLAATVACGRCGTATQMCIAGNVSTGGCMGEHGACAATDVQRTPDGCMIKHCAPDCSMWGFWEYIPPAQCSYGAGEIAICPLTGCGLSDTGHKKCLPSCKFGPCQCS